MKESQGCKLIPLELFDNVTLQLEKLEALTEITVLEAERHCTDDEDLKRAAILMAMVQEGLRELHAKIGELWDNGLPYDKQPEGK